MISQQEYQTRRRQLAAKLPSGAIALIPGAEEVLRNGDAHYRFRQASDFYYLTGFNEPDAVLLLSAEGESCFFNRSRNPSEEQWTGKRLGQEGAITQLGMKNAFSIDDLPNQLPKLLSDRTAIYYSLGQQAKFQQSILQAIALLKTQARSGVKAPNSLCDLAPLLSEMRLFKSEAEINAMRRAAAISVSAHQHVMKACRHAEYEYELEAEFLYELNRHGCQSVAYSPIVGGGENTCILHYIDNNQPLRSGDLLLIDAGAEYDNYAADITRTFPINGQFSPEQRAIYELVLKAQQAGIACIKPGIVWIEVQAIIVRILTTGLCELGLLKGEVDELIASEAYKPFYMHKSGHWLGLDVHDCGAYKINNEWRKLEPGMVLTVEPGIYISAGMNVEERWWNIGIRIEDDILVTAKGHENLTQALPVNPDEIEVLMRD